MNTYKFVWQEEKKYEGEFENENDAREWWREMDANDTSNFDDVTYYDLEVDLASEGEEGE